MNGPEHYRRAEDLVHDACLILEHSTPATADAANAGASALAAAAQVHATLALAAATAAQQATAYDGDEYGQRSRGWAGVA